MVYGCHVVKRDLGDGHSAPADQDAASPHTQGDDRYQFPMCKVDDEYIAECGWRIVPCPSYFYFLPIFPQRNLELPELFPPFDSMAQGDSCTG